MVTAERTVKGHTSVEHRFSISSLPPDVARTNCAVRQHWRIGDSLHWGLDVLFGDDQTRARTDHAAENLSVLRHLMLDLLRLNPDNCTGVLKVQRLVAASSDILRAKVLGLV